MVKYDFPARIVKKGRQADWHHFAWGPPRCIELKVYQINVNNHYGRPSWRHSRLLSHPIPHSSLDSSHPCPYMTLASAQYSYSCLFFSWLFWGMVGSNCAVSTYQNRSFKAKKEGRVDLTFHRWVKILYSICNIGCNFYSYLLIVLYLFHRKFMKAFWDK